ncbi:MULTISPECIES: hypothetical protein [unclassified Shewanella]|uniref:hypothetical protein n=1 Tax=unclassified Shewanella TaxID=196818 RepID=UPI00354EE9A2
MNTSIKRKVNYRAIHTKNAWRKASHQSIENALGHKRGAKALFSGKAAIDYSKHGDPLYVIVWEEGCQSGFVVKQSSSNNNELIKVELPINKINKYEDAGSVCLEELSGYFKLS